MCVFCDELNAPILRRRIPCPFWFTTNHKQRSEFSINTATSYDLIINLLRSTCMWNKYGGLVRCAQEKPRVNQTITRTVWLECMVHRNGHDVKWFHIFVVGRVCLLSWQRLARRDTRCLCLPPSQPALLPQPEQQLMNGAPLRPHTHTLPSTFSHRLLIFFYRYEDRW
jgi:hypothetical protein